MKNILLFVFIVLASTSFSQEEMKYEGVYDGKNIFILNRAIKKDKHCVKGFSINGVEVKAPKDHAFEIKLDEFVKLNESYVLIIYHRKHCKPRVLSEEQAN